jgi:hypothetical protein
VTVSFVLLGTGMVEASVFSVRSASCAFLVGLAAACGTSSTATPAPAGPDASTDDAGAGTAGAMDAVATPTEAGGAEVGSDVTASSEPGDARTEGGRDASLDAPRESSAPTSLVRFANWAPDAPAAGFDVCLSTTSGATWTGPLLGAGIAFPMVSAYASVAPGVYSLRVVAGGGGRCDSPVEEAGGLPELLAGSRITFALIGAAFPVGNDPPGKVVALTDEGAPGGPHAFVRFVNATPAAAAVDFGAIAPDGSFTLLVVDVQFGQPPFAPSVSGLVPDANGYVSLLPQGGVRLSARDVGTTTVVATGSNAGWPVGSASTVAVVNGMSGGPAPQLLLCRDDGPTNGNLSACSVLAP